MSIELAMPLKLAPNGTFATVSSTSDMVGQHVRALIGTAQGQRAVYRAYGLPVRVFDSNMDLETELPIDVGNAFSSWEKGATMLGIDIQDGDDGGSTARVVYQIINSVDNSRLSAVGVGRVAIGRGGKIIELANV